MKELWNFSAVKWRNLFHSEKKFGLKGEKLLEFVRKQQELEQEEKRLEEKCREEEHKEKRREEEKEEK